MAIRICGQTSAVLPGTAVDLGERDPRVGADVQDGPAVGADPRGGDPVGVGGVRVAGYRRLDGVVVQAAEEAVGAVVGAGSHVRGRW